MTSSRGSPQRSTLSAGRQNVAVKKKERRIYREHFDDTVTGDFWRNQPPPSHVRDGYSIIYSDRMGVPFSRTKEGLLDFRRFGGTKHHRTAFAGASTGQQLLYALDEQVRRREAEGKVQKYEGWEMMSLVMDDHGVCRGLVAMNLQTLELKAFRADAVIMATGGPGLIFGSQPTLWSAQQPSPPLSTTRKYANAIYKVHPNLSRRRKAALMSESARAEAGGWVPKARETAGLYSIPKRSAGFPRRKISAYGTSFRGHRQRANLSVSSKGWASMVRTKLLNLSHIPPDLGQKACAILEIYEMLVARPAQSR